MEESSRAFPGTRGVAESMIWSVADAMGTYTREMEVVGIRCSPESRRQLICKQEVGPVCERKDVQTTTGAVLM